MNLIACVEMQDSKGYEYRTLPEQTPKPISIHPRDLMHRFLLWHDADLLETVSAELVLQGSMP